MNTKTLEATARMMVADGKGLLGGADENLDWLMFMLQAQGFDGTRWD